MHNDNDPTAKWFVVRKDLKVFTACGKCGNNNLSNRRAWMSGSYAEVSSCSSCQRQYPIRMKAAPAKNAQPLFRRPRLNP
jgi:hypothetical protein